LIDLQALLRQRLAESLGAGLLVIQIAIILLPGVV
jgi:hypothetical protein